MLVKERGLVVRTFNVGEKDKILTIFTENHGLLSVYANGSRVVKSKLLAAADLFCYADYVFSCKNERYTVREADLLESFYTLRTDLVRTALGDYVLDVVRTAGTENQPDVPFLRLVLNTLYAIASGKYELSHIKAAFEVRAAADLGFCPDLFGCSVCGCTDGDMTMDVMNGTMMCAKCRRELQNAIITRPEEEEGHRTVLCVLTPAAVAAWRYCTECPSERFLSFRLDGETDKRLFYRSAEEFLLNHLDRGFTSLEFYRQMAPKENGADD